MELYSAKARKIIEDIKAVKIQGARNIAKAALEAFLSEVEAFPEKEGIEQHIIKLRSALLETRPTEPMARNLLETVSRHVLSLAVARSLDELKAELSRGVEKILEDLDARFNKMLENGANRIEDGSVVMTICHSSSVVGILRRAKEKGKTFSVISCETRPLFQGRITARELAEANIPVKSIVDSAAASFIKDADIALVGADAINSLGDLYNKIGTRMLAHLSYEYDTPFYSAAELLKFDPKTLFGHIEPIEFRPPEEVWDSPPEGVEVINPAFDKTPAKYVSAYICEEGIIPPQRFGELFEETYRA